jgi:Flp pilus assembly protein TadG
MRQRILDYLRREDGVAAVEMGLILPFIAGFAVVSVNVWDVGQRKQDMRGALKLAGQYYMNGGADDSAARTIALAQWNHKPATSDVTITRSYYCPATSSTVADASTLCSDNTAPQIIVQLHGSATTSSAMFFQTQTADEYVRIR